jgi:hypothetical protein
VLHIQQATVVELDLRVAVPLEVNAEGRKLDDGLELRVRPILDTCLGLVLEDNLGILVQGGATDDDPLLGLIVAFLADRAVVS